MRKFLLYVASVAIFAMPGQCASVVITTIATCATDNGTVTSSAACNLDGASADSAASYSISGNTLTINLADDADVTGTIGSGTAQSSILLDIITAGSVRPGFVVAMENGYVLGDGKSTPNGSSAFGVANLYSVVGFMCNDASGCNYGEYTGNNHPLPITLGIDIGVSASASAEANVFSLEVTGSSLVAAAGGSASFQFFEADGVTPVDIALATPEPSLGAFTGMLSLFLAGSWSIRQNGQRVYAIRRVTASAN